jgi:hypothetical protein
MKPLPKSTAGFALPNSTCKNCSCKNALGAHANGEFSKPPVGAAAIATAKVKEKKSRS